VPLKPTPDPRDEKKEKKRAEPVGAVSGLKDIYKDPKKVSKKKQPQEFLKEVQTTRTKPAAAEPADDDDDDEIPPLDGYPKR